MKKFKFSLKEYISKGLAHNNNKRDQPMLVEAIGAIPYSKVLQAVEQFIRVDTSGIGVLSFPYPQLFVLSELILVCTEDSIYELNPNTQVLTLKKGGLPVGTTWDVVDFKSFIVLVNTQVTITRDISTGEYSVSTTLPNASCICNYNGQVLLGSPIEI